MRRLLWNRSGDRIGPRGRLLRLPEFRIGLTDISKTASGSAQEVGRRGFDPARLAAAITAAAPDHLAFNGKNAARGALGRPGDIGPWRELTRDALSTSGPP
ncbi:MAG: hypothetical protein JST53_10135 [Actinobacteria bacterium]|nr:hypothetical protein [Actinomycetota bacterium]